MGEEDRGRASQSGYRKSALVLNRAFNAILALLLIVLTLPIFVFLWLLVWIVEGRPVLYRGFRLGLHKKPFIMYKFRTLVHDAETILGADLVGSHQGLVTPLGKFLRDTRLDELPQLFNVLKGDMDFVGPRPERPAVYEKICRHIRDYDRRFEVKPALIGFSQLYTPHGTPKRIRTLIDNRLLHKKQLFLWDVWIVFATGLVVLRTTFVRLASALWDLVQERVFRRYREKRESDRVPQEAARVRWGANGTPDATTAELIDVNEQAFLMRAGKKVEGLPPTFVLEVEIGVRRGVVRRKHATCLGSVVREQPRPDGAFDYVVRYEPATPFQYYMVHQYFLKQSIVDHD